MSADKLQFLVVEDDEDDFVHVRQLLNKTVGGADVARATSADAALKLASECPPDLCVMDYRLGDKDGLDVLRELKNRDVEAPVIFLTGHGDEEVAVQAMKAGAVDYLLKSKLTAPSLGAAVRYALTLHKKEEAVRLARQALHASEQRFRALVENSSDIVALADAKFTLLYVSPSVLRVMGYRPDEVVERPVFDFVHPEDHVRVRELFSKLWQSKMPIRADYRVRHKDGTWLYIEATAMNRLQDAAVGAIVINARDVTERRRAEDKIRASNQALRRSEREYRTLFENANDAIMIFEPEEEKILAVNRKACEIYGFTREEMVGMSLRQQTEDVERGRKAVEEVLRAGSLKDFETVHRRKDGTPVYILANASAIEYRGKRAVLSVSRDMTERKLAETKLRTLSSAVEKSADVVVITARDGAIEYVNPAFESLTGYSREEAVGKTPRILKSGKQDNAFYQAMWRKITAGQVFRDVLINRKKNGDLYHTEKTITPVLNQRGAIEHFISNDRDITERRELEQQLLQAQKMDAVGQLAGGVAHDFNNLLMVISSYAELLSEALEGNEKARHQAEEIRKAARRASGLTQQLLAFSRKQVMSPRILDLNGVVAEIGRMLPRVIGEDIQMVIKPGEKLWQVQADPLQLEQVIMNLAVNARDAMPRGGQLTLETANACLDTEYARHKVAVTPGEYVLLAVTDTGCGIAPEVLPHIFEPFFTTKEQGKGTGLGLPTVYGIVKQSGGFVWVYSEVGHGTVFKVYLPRARRAAEKSPEDTVAPAPARGSETLLVVEDEDAVRESISESLSSRGYTVLQGKNGADALQVLEHFAAKIDLLITDVVMPGMSGAELAKRVRELRPETRILFVSGYTESTVVRHGIHTDCGFLQKPFTLPALARKVRELIDTGGPPAVIRAGENTAS